MTASSDKTARLNDLEGATHVVFEGHEGAVNSAVFSPDGNYVLTASSDRTARLWDLQGNQVGVFRGHRGSLFSAAFSPDGEYIVTASMDGKARVWLAHTGDLLALADKRVNRDFTEAERALYADLLGD